MMRITSLTINGYRSLCDIEKMPLSSLTIFVGRNNSGKSNLLSALNLLLAGTAKELSENDFYECGGKRVPEICIEATLVGITEYLPLCAEQHRGKIAVCIQDDSIKIRRKATLQPLEMGKTEIWQPEKNEYGTPTGIDTAFRQFLPEMIFIEVFKDPSDEVQGKGSATLAKLLKEIVEQVSDQITGDVDEALSSANRKFNVIQQEDKLIDERPEELRRIEGRIKEHVQKIFNNSDVRLAFSLPDVNALMTTASIRLRDRPDGSWTPLSHKGQGFQRTLYVALLQALADELRATSEAPVSRPFILLFEEPELFLHPALQREIGDTIEAISQSNQVVVSTHSPLLITPQRFGDVIIVQQIQNPETRQSKTRCMIPDIENLPDPEEKQLAMLLRYANSSEFLFADCVMIVEGPSDKALFGASWDMHREAIVSKIGSISLAIIEAENKNVVPVWLKYLRSLHIRSVGVVDLDFLWSGAGKVLGADPEVSIFSESFWKIAEEKGVSQKNEKGIWQIEDKK
ncbi:MAG: AAA family ATPase, partial [Thermoplasmata archaeon]|nr:AAA family ATPase [Thermoplasmata archaeon]